MLNLLVVDDEMVILQGIVKILREGKTPFTRIEGATDADEANSLMSHFSPDLIVTDINMPGKNGLEWIAEVKDQDQCDRFIILTGYDEFEYAKQAIRIQVIDYLLKPINKMEILSLLRKVANEIFAEQDRSEPSDKNKTAGHSDYSFHVQKIIHYIERNYEQDLSLDQCSELTDLHPNYISYLFKKEIGKTFIQYVHDYRIMKARELLLKHRTLPVQTIGSQVGYENPQHFMKVFKKIAGCTPGSFRDNNRHS